VLLRVVPGPDGSTVFVVQARRPVGAGSRTIVAELPKPELAMATGLVALHHGSLVVERGETEVGISFCLPPLAPAPAIAYDRSRATDEEREKGNEPSEEEGLA
jgi:hypothetical protein